MRGFLLPMDLLALGSVDLGRGISLLRSSIARGTFHRSVKIHLYIASRMCIFRFACMEFHDVPLDVMVELHMYLLGVGRPL